MKIQSDSRISLCVPAALLGMESQRTLKLEQRVTWEQGGLR